MAVSFDRGDLVWVNFNPQRGHEQAGHRPAVVISPKLYNDVSNCILACPITSNTAQWPWKILLQGEGPIAGGVLVDQIRAVDVKARKVTASGHVVGPAIMDQILARLATLTGE